MGNLNYMICYTLMEKRLGGHRIIGALLLLFFFFLPLHFHAIDESRQISHECSCYHGARTQLAPIPSLIILPISPSVFLAVVDRDHPLVSLVIESDLARAPPVSL